MKQSAFLVLLAIAVLLVIAGCERKVVNEIVQEAPAADIGACFTCHSDSDVKLVAARQQYELSVHYLGDTQNRNRNNSSRYASCEGCHTNEGFVARVTGEPFEGDHFTTISCFTCHQPHTSGTLGLQTMAAVTLENGGTFNNGAGNLCASCHHSRADVDTYIVAGDTLNTHWGPHHSNQSDMLAGTNGYEFAGYDYGSSPHGAGAEDGCLQCHMNKSLWGTGGHAFNMTDEEEEYENVSGCNTGCHEGSVEGFDHDGLQADITDKLLTLETLLLDAGLLALVDEDGELIPEPNEDHVLASVDEGGALFNYLFIKEDRSKGIHNPDYAEDLLQSAIDFMSAAKAPENPGQVDGGMIAAH